MVSEMIRARNRKETTVISRRKRKEEDGQRKGADWFGWRDQLSLATLHLEEGR